MKPVRDINPVRLPARCVHCVEDGKDLEITAVSGTVWITQACDRRDVILTRGQSFILDRHGRAVVYALKDAGDRRGACRPHRSRRFSHPA